MAKIWHFSGAGNDFVVLDGRREDLSAFRDAAEIGRLCREYRTDGLMILSEGAPGEDFTMEFYNPDGSSGMMCGNGGRCIAAFAHLLGIPYKGAYLFRAADGLHTAEILSREGSRWVVRLGMKDVDGVTPVLGGYFLDTGTRHFVKFVPDVEAVDIATEGPVLRHAPEFAPVGANVNFVQILPGGAIKVRTFEKGVEGETLACGTGITASAIATAYASAPQHPADASALHSVAAEADLPGSHSTADLHPADAAWHIPVQARRDELAVDFVRAGSASFRHDFLTGPAELL